MKNKPKTKTSIRKVYFDNSLLTLIKKYKKKIMRKNAFSKEGIIFKDKDYFILSSRNLPIKQSRITYMFRLLCEKGRSSKNITVHGLRHTHATFLIEAGANIKYVSNQVRTQEY